MVETFDFELKAELAKQNGESEDLRNKDLNLLHPRCLVLDVRCQPCQLKIVRPLSHSNEHLPLISNVNDRKLSLLSSESQFYTPKITIVLIKCTF